MKYVSILRLAPGVDNVKKAFETFGEVGTEDGLVALYASSDGKRFVSIVEADEPDLVRNATYAPFFESSTVMPVVDVDEYWMTAMAAATENMS